MFARLTASRRKGGRCHPLNPESFLTGTALILLRCQHDLKLMHKYTERRGEKATSKSVANSDISRVHQAHNRAVPKRLHPGAIHFKNAYLRCVCSLVAGSNTPPDKSVFVFWCPVNWDVSFGTFNSQQMCRFNRWYHAQQTTVMWSLQVWVNERHSCRRGAKMWECTKDSEDRSLSTWYLAMWFRR